MGKVFQIITFLAAMTIFGMVMVAQDLGSSNKLFGGAKNTAPRTSKKATAKSTVRKARPHTRASRAVKTVRKSTATARIPVRIAPPMANVIIRIAPRRTEKTTTAEQGTKTPIVADKISNTAYDDLIAEGNESRDRRDYFAAETAYHRAGTAMPKDIRAAVGLGKLYVDTMRWEDAEKAYRSAIQIEPDDVLSHVALSFILTQPVAAPNLSDRYDEAEKLARRALELQPNNTLAYDQTGAALERRGLIGAETESAYRTAIRLDPAFAPAYAHLGRLLRRRGRTNEATTADKDAVARANDVPAMILVADTMQSEQRFADSVQLLKRALAKDPRNPSVLVMLGRALTAGGNFEEAEAFLKKSTDVSPDSFAGYSLLGTVYSRQGRFEVAENILLQASRFASANEKRDLAAQFETVGDGYAKSGKTQAAARVYRKALTLDAERGTLATKIARSSR